MVRTGKLLLLPLLFFSFLALTACKETPPISIGITQLANHPALQDARQGFLDVLREHGYHTGINLHVDIRSAHGDLRTAQAIAEDFVREEKDLIFALTTPSAQAAYSATKTIPIIFTAVTDPVEAGIAESFLRSGTNVTGTSNGLPMGPQLDCLEKILPEAKTLGVFYSDRELNARVQVLQLIEEAALRGLTVEARPILKMEDLHEALPLLLRQVDVLYVPTDNTLAVAMEELLAHAKEENIPVVAADAAWVHSGALFALSIDYYALGRDAGLKAIDVLRGKDPSDIPITTQHQPHLHVNKTTADAFGIFIPLDILETAVIVVDHGP